MGSFPMLIYFVGKTSIVDVLFKGKRGTNDPSCCVHYVLQGLSIFDGATSEPHSNTVGQDTCICIN